MGQSGIQSLIVMMLCGFRMIMIYFNLTIVLCAYLYPVFDGFYFSARRLVLSDAMHKFTQRSASHTIPIFSCMHLIPSLYSSFLNSTNFIFTKIIIYNIYNMHMPTT